jgi:hypothetical protein
MRLLSWTLGVVVSLASLTARAETFGALTFDALDGWQRDDQAGQVIFTRGDATKGTWATVMLLEGRKSLGTVEADFRDAWTLAAVLPLKVAAVQPLVADVMGGFRVASSTAKVSVGGRPAAIFVATYSNGRVSAPVVYMGNSEDSVLLFLAWLERMKVAAPAVVKSVAAPAVDAGVAVKKPAK